MVHLAQHFIDELTREQGLLPMTLSDEVVAALGAHLWPGNARERRSGNDIGCRVGIDSPVDEFPAGITSAVPCGQPGAGSPLGAFHGERQRSRKWLRCRNRSPCSGRLGADQEVQFA